MSSAHRSLAKITAASGCHVGACARRSGRVVGVLAGMIDLSLPNFINRMTDNRYGQTGETFW